MKAFTYTFMISFLLIFTACGSSSSDTKETNTQAESNNTDTTTSNEENTTETPTSTTHESNTTKLAYTIVDRVKNLGNLTALTRSADRLYLGNYDGTLYIFNITDASKPKLLSTLITQDIIEDIAIKNNTLYIANNVKGLTVVDISDTTAPTIIKSLPAGYARSIEISDNNIYLASGYAGIYVFDATSLSQLSHISVEGDYTDSILVVNGLAYTSDSFSDNITVTDLSTGLKVTQIEKADGLYAPKEDLTTTRDANVLFVAETYGFEIFNISNTENISKIASVNQNDTNPINHITLSLDESKAYISKLNSGLNIYNIEDINNPQLQYVLDLNETQNEVISPIDSTLSLDGEYLYIMTYNGELITVSIAEEIENINSSSIQLDNWDAYGTVEEIDGVLTVGDSIGNDANDIDNDGNTWNRLADGSTEYDYDAIVSKADFIPPIKLTFDATLKNTSLGYNVIGIAEKNSDFTNIFNEGLPIGETVALFSIDWEEQDVLRVYTQNIGYTDTFFSVSDTLSGTFVIDWDGNSVSYYYNNQKIAEQSLPYDATKTFKIFAKTYEKDFRFTNITIE